MGKFCKWENATADQLINPQPNQTIMQTTNNPANPNGRTLSDTAKLGYCWVVIFLGSFKLARCSTVNFHSLFSS